MFPPGDAPPHPPAAPGGVADLPGVPEFDVVAVHGAGSSCAGLSRRCSHWRSALRRIRTPPPGSRTARRPGALPAPAVERGPGHPQLRDHLLDGQQLIASCRAVRFACRGSGGLDASGACPPAAPVRAVCTTHARLRPGCQVRPPRAPPAAGGLGRLDRGEGWPGRKIRASRRLGRQSAGVPGREPRPGARGGRRLCRGSRMAASGADLPPPSPGAGSRAGGQVWLACHPGPAVCTPGSARGVKSGGPPCRPAPAGCRA